ncbi:MAG: hypothetical protein CM15mP103_11750 [Gammaproteobacteria bacterium]|nr:MAG: hypothetical protein CM15mP103_11750 [Gammaproteobacteria bacterium]
MFQGHPQIVQLQGLCGYFAANVAKKSANDQKSGLQVVSATHSRPYYPCWRISPWRPSWYYMDPTSICWVPASPRSTVRKRWTRLTIACNPKPSAGGKPDLPAEQQRAGNDRGGSSSARRWTQFIIINPAAFTHTSVALRDALAGVDIPCIEVHISNVYAREPFRHHSYISDIAEAVISGLGSFGYDCALAAVLQSLDTHSTTH